METFASFSVPSASGALQKVYGMLHLPDATPDTPVPPRGWPSVVMLHGFTSSRAGDHRLFVSLSRLLAAHGVASLRFDFRGSGESEGGFEQTTITGQVADTLAAGEYIRRQPHIDPQRVMLLGHSLGAMVATLSAQEFDAHRLLLWAPALPDAWLVHLPGGVVPAGVSDLQGWPVGRDFFLELPRLNPLKAAREWGGVAQVIHGDADAVCPPAWGVRYAQALGADAVAIPDASHSFESLSHTDELLRLSLQFVLGRPLELGAASAPLRS